MQVSEAKVAEYIKYLNRVETFVPVLSKKEKQLSQALVEVHFLKDEIILEEGEMGNSFYILHDGTSSTMRKASRTSKAEDEVVHAGDVRVFDPCSRLGKHLRLLLRVQRSTYGTLPRSGLPPEHGVAGQRSTEGFGRTPMSLHERRRLNGKDLSRR